MYLNHESLTVYRARKSRPIVEAQYAKQARIERLAAIQSAIDDAKRVKALRGLWAGFDREGREI